MASARACVAVGFTCYLGRGSVKSKNRPDFLHEEKGVIFIVELYRRCQPKAFGVDDYTAYSA